MHVRLRTKDSIVTLDLPAAGGGRQTCRVGDREYEIEPLHMTENTIVVRIGERIHRAIIARDGASVLVGLDGAVHRFTPESAVDDELPSGRGSRSGRVEAPMPGKILNLLIKVGDRVGAGQPLVTLEAMKMEHTLLAEIDGSVTSLSVRPGSMVSAGELLLEIAPDGDS